jgi:hypothetical protein
MKGTIYGGRLRRGTQAKNVWEPLLKTVRVPISKNTEFSANKLIWA